MITYIGTENDWAYFINYFDDKIIEYKMKSRNPVDVMYQIFLNIPIDVDNYSEINKQAWFLINKFPYRAPECWIYIWHDINDWFAQYIVQHENEVWFSKCANILCNKN